jgi:hypothetical protein
MADVEKLFFLFRFQDDDDYDVDEALDLRM